MKKIKAKPLIPGDKIGIIAPASPVKSSEQVTEAISVLVERGYRIVLGKTAIPMSGDLAGSDLVKQAELEKLWYDQSIKAIWCLRGGYGSIRLIPRLWFGLFAKIPKILIGFSDITALELAIWSQAGLVTFHGPVLTHLKSSFSITKTFELLENREITLNWPENKIYPEYTVIKKGQAQGVLLGGNLTTLNSLMGTKYMPNFEGVIIFIEEVGEEAYKIDRMLSQLIISGIFGSAAAVLVGRSLPAPSWTEAELIAVFVERLSLLDCPSAYGFPIGHFHHQWTLPQGVWAEINIDKGNLKIIESPFS